MSIINESYCLNNKINIPKIALGTWFLDNKKVPQVIADATKIGYRHIDTAQAYENEEGVGEGIKNCGIPREELFITTKIRAEHKTYEEAKQSIYDSLEKLGTDYIDLMIIHSPEPWMEFREDEKNYDGENIDVWKALEDAYNEGIVKSIGLSNFLIEDIQNILDNCEIKPMVNQILVHIGCTPSELIKYCEDNDILVEAYAPIAHGAATSSDEIKKIADNYNVSIAQLCLRYTIELGLLPLPKASSIEHLKSNIDIDFNITKEDMNTLKALKDIIDYGNDKKFPVFSGKNY